MGRIVHGTKDAMSLDSLFARDEKTNADTLPLKSC